MVISDPAEHIYAFTFGVFAAFMILEMLLPRRDSGGNMAVRWGSNFSLGMLNWYITSVAGTFLVISVAKWANMRELGVLRGLDWGPLPEFIILLAATQFAGYWVHVAFHKIPWLWPIHAVHHSDPDFDVSTGYRHHPLEPLITLPISMPIVVALGVSPEAAAIYRFFAVFATVFSHCNVHIPQALERPLRLVLLTPDFHRIHHRSDQPYTDSNYGSLVPWFDYLFGTARHCDYDEHESMEIGLEYFRDDRDTRLDQMLVQPLNYRQASAARRERPPREAHAKP